MTVIDLLDKALDLIIELVEDDPSDICLVVDANNEGYCKNNCENFNRTCLLKYLEQYNKTSRNYDTNRKNRASHRKICLQVF